MAAALDCSDSIRAAYRAHAQHKPLIEFNLQEQRLYAYSHLEYKATLSERSQTMLTEQYEKAQLQNQIVVFIKDEDSRPHVRKSQAIRDFLAEHPDASPRNAAEALARSGDSGHTGLRNYGEGHAGIAAGTGHAAQALIPYIPADRGNG